MSIECPACKAARLCDSSCSEGWLHPSAEHAAVFVCNCCGRFYDVITGRPCMPEPAVHSPEHMRAVGAALTATFLRTSERELADTGIVGARFLEALAQHGLTIAAIGELPATPALLRRQAE